GTTSSNKDGWFLGFSSGITTGVWMGRDDAKPVPGLQGGAAPARAFAAFMRYAVRNRPVEKFDTELQLPEWQLEPDDEYLMSDPNDYYFVDENGNLIEPGRAGNVGRSDSAPGEPANTDAGMHDRRGSPPAAGAEFLDRATGRAGAVDPALRAAPPLPGRPVSPGGGAGSDTR
ncbi:MAG: penicillin-binding protein, partial [Novosphingobium sp.]|nr:penicillin-binding protein [Novosphingobium sp.]